MTDKATEQTPHRFAKDQLRSIVERIERLEEEKKAIADDIRDVYAEAKGNGFDTTAIRTIVRLRKQDADQRREQEEILETYMHALGMLSDTPLGQAALDRVAKKAVERVAKSPALRKAVEKMGTPVALTEEEKAKGYSAAFIGKDGTRMAIGLGDNVQARNPGNSGGSSPPPSSTPPPQSPPPAAPPPSAQAIALPSDGSLPTFLMRGHPECRLGANG